MPMAPGAVVGQVEVGPARGWLEGKRGISARSCRCEGKIEKKHGERAHLWHQGQLLVTYRW